MLQKLRLALVLVAFVREEFIISIMEYFGSRFGRVVLTAERLDHILTFHPEIRKYRRYFTRVLTRPELIRRSKFDPRVFIFYSQVVQGKFLSIVVKTNNRNFILTAYLTSKI